MILDTLILQEFRNHKKESFAFSPHTTLIIGKNTSGKTNILEAITMLATGRSFRAERQYQVIRFDKEVARITGSLNSDVIEIVATNGSVLGKKAPLKKCLYNGVSKRMIDFAGRVKVVLFWPEDIRLIIGSPSGRRKYLDSVLIQIDREYRRNIQSYEKGLRQRNKVLEKISDGEATRNQLGFWDNLLIKSGGYITDARITFLNYINNYDISHVSEMSENTASYQVEYKKSVISVARLKQYEKEEVFARRTLVGPHRDDVGFGVKDSDSHIRELAGYGSRGEQRMAVLWIKLAELSYIHEETDDRPILLLDDIFSELDASHRKVVLSIIGNQQTIITSADKNISLLDSDKTKIISLNNH